jgi:hypothetical protein
MFEEDLASSTIDLSLSKVTFFIGGSIAVILLLLEHGMQRTEHRFIVFD